MAVVPTYERQVKAAPAPGPYQTASGATPDAFGAGVARAQGEMGKSVGQLGDQLYDYAVKEQTLLDQTHAKSLDNDYTQKINDLLYGNPETGQEGFYNKRGVHSVNAAAATSAEMRKIRQDTIDSAPNDRVKATLAGALQAREDVTNKSFRRQWESQKLEYDKEVSEARMGFALNGAVHEWRSEEKLQESKDIMTGTALVQAKRLGKDGLLIDQAVLETRTSLINGVATAAMDNGDLKRAAEILEQHGEDIDGVVLATLQKRLEGDTHKAIVTGIVDAAEALYSDQPQKAFEYIKKNTEGQDRIDSLALFSRNRTLNKGIKDEQKQALEDQTYKHHFDIVNKGDPAALPQALASISPNDRKTMGETNYNNLEKIAKARSSQHSILVTPENRGLLRGLMQTSPQALLTANIDYEFLAKTLTKEQYATFSTHINTIQAKGKTIQQAVIAATPRFNAFARRLGASSSGKPADLRRYGYLEEVWNGAIASKARDKQYEPLTDADYTAIEHQLFESRSYERQPEANTVQRALRYTPSKETVNARPDQVLRMLNADRRLSIRKELRDELNREPNGYEIAERAMKRYGKDK